MTLLVRWIVGVIAAAGLGFLAWKPVEAAYFTKCSALESKIEKLRDDIRLCEDGLEKRPGLDAALEGFVNRTFGGDLETVDHRLRSRLNRIGESLELTDLTVGTAKSRSVASPARTVFSNRRQKTLRDEIDFVELEGWVAGRGTLEQALRLVHWIEAEPWPKRIYDVRLEPKEAGKAFNVNVRFITIFLPGRAPDEIAESAPAATLTAGQGVLARDPFRLPAPAPPAAKQSPKRTGFPYQKWALTGVVTAPGGAEAWLHNAETGESRSLTVGDTIGKLVLVSATGERAVFGMGEKTVELLIGEQLRAP
jgi:hypothetical protein